MRRGRTLIFLIIAIVLVVVVIGALVLVPGLLSPTGPAVATETASSQVYFASQNIPQGTTITQDMLGTFSIPQGNVAEVMFTAGEEANLIGQKAKFALDQGTLITSSMVGAGAGELTGPVWASLVPSGMVAAAIPTNRLATAAYGVNDGAHVNVNACMTFVDVDPSYQSVLPNYVSAMHDVYFPTGAQPTISLEPVTQELPSRQGRVELDPTFQKPIYTVPSETQRPRLVCQMILQDVVVMNLGNFQLQAPVVDPNATPSPAAQQEASPDIVTLMVTPQDSIALNYFVLSGAVITMALRNPNDNSRIDAQSATLTSILTQYNISLPSKLPYGQQPRLDVLTLPALPNDVIQAQP
ncbi:MAG: SAF domain-containing protein [Chloroflexota bacterium]